MKSEIQIQAGLWKSLCLVLAGALAVNGIAALLGWADFAWWHLPSLGICVLFWQPPVGKWLKAMKKLGGKIAIASRRLYMYFAKGSGRSGAPFVNEL